MKSILTSLIRNFNPDHRIISPQPVVPRPPKYPDGKITTAAPELPERKPRTENKEEPMIRYEATKPEMSEALRAIGKTNEERAREMALSWMAIGTDGDDMSAADYYRYYDKGYRYFLKELEARDEK